MVVIPSANTVGTVLVGLLTSATWFAWRQHNSLLLQQQEQLASAAISAASDKPQQTWQEDYLWHVFINNRPTGPVEIGHLGQAASNSFILLHATQDRDGVEEEGWDEDERAWKLQQAWNGVVQAAWERAFDGRVAIAPVDNFLGMRVVLA